MITALGPRLGLGLRLDFGSQVWFVQYFSENLVVVLYAGDFPTKNRKKTFLYFLISPRGGGRG